MSASTTWGELMYESRLRFLFLSIGHFLDHFFVLIFATAALHLTQEWGLSYAELIPYATPGFIAFGIGAIPAGWLADKWSREGMMGVFFVGIGACAVLASMADSPFEMGIALTFVGMFAAIYHPVGLAMVVQGLDKTGVPLAINGVFGNMGVASAALVTGFLVDLSGWKSAFIVPGVLSIVTGILFLIFVQKTQVRSKSASFRTASPKRPDSPSRRMLLRILGIIFFTTALGGLVFQSTTFALPKLLDERLAGMSGSMTEIGSYAFLVFSIAAMAQLVVGYLMDNHSARTVLATVAGFQAVFFLAVTQLEGVAALLAAIAFMLAVFGQIPINDVLIGRVTRSEWRSRAYALRYIVTFSVMASAVPLIAVIHGSWGFNILFMVLSGVALLILLASWLLPAKEEALFAPQTAST